MREGRGISRIKDFFLVLIMSFLFMKSSSLFAEDTSFDERLSRIRQMVEEQTKDLRETEESQKKISQELKTHEVALKDLQVRKNQLLSEYRQNQDKRISLTQSLKKTEQKLKDLEMNSRSRLRSLYMSGEEGSLLALFQGTGDTLLRHAFYMSRIGKSDQKLMKELLVARTNVAFQQEGLDRLLQDQEELQKQIEEQSAETNRRILTQRDLFREFQARRATIQKALASLKLEAKKLEEVVASLTIQPLEAREPIERPSPQESEDGNGWLRSSEAYNGTGLPRSIPLPSSGQVVNSFGKKKVGGFEDYIFNKGLEISCPRKSPVRAVAAGLVRFIGKMPGYGLLLLVDHGNRMFSLYGRLGEVQSSVGREVQVGEVLALSSDPDEKGRNLYFEIRKGGAAVNPLPFFRDRFPK